MIITNVKNQDIDVFALQYPDQLASEKKKLSEDYIKNTLDYFWNIGVQQVLSNKRTFGRNYDLVKGTLSPRDFFQEVPKVGFGEMDLEACMKEEGLPEYVQDYSIINTPLSILMGEMSKRPDTVLVRAMDDDSQAQENQYKTEILKQYVTQQVQQQIIMKAAQQGQELDQETLDQMTEEELADKLSNYTSNVERWSSRVLEALKMRFGMREKSEEAFGDLLKSARDYFHIYEDNSTLGFNIEVPNTVNTFILTTPGKKYISDPLDESNGAYAAGILSVMELSEILHKYTLTEKEMKHLRDLARQEIPVGGETSNLFIPSAQGIDSIKYQTYYRELQREKWYIDSYLDDNPTQEPFDGFNKVVTNYGNKFSVMQMYWCSKIKIGKLTYIDEEGQPVTMMVDENYKAGMHPTEIDLVWGYTNQWWKGTRIGPDIYIEVEPFKLLEYCPIVGCIHDPKNLTKIKSFVDMLKPFQTMCNVYINKLYEKINQDWGNVILTSIRHISVPKDGDPQDAIAQWEEQARAKGIIFVDDSPENTKGASSFNQHTVLQASRAQEMQAYHQLYQAIKLEAWSLVGITPQRQGEIAATTTATGVQTAMSQSYAQTEPLFAQHEYVMNRVYQAMLDAAVYIYKNKEFSTLSFITNEGDSGSISITGEELQLKDLWVFCTSRTEDNANLQQFKQLSQAMLQNGASAYEIALMHSTKSTRYILDAFKRLKEQQDAMAQQQQQMQQQELEQKQQQFQQAQQMALQQHMSDQENENFQKEMDRQSKERIALIAASGFGKIEAPDLGGEAGVPDVYELENINMQRSKMEKDHEAKQKDFVLKQMQILQKNQSEAANRELQKEKLNIEREKIKSAEKIARTNKNKYDK